MEAPAACTMAHVVRDAAGKLYVLTAGHCVGGVGQRVALTNDGDIGFVRAFRNQGVGNDFALVEIDLADYARVDPNMLGWNGPVGLASAPETGLAAHYGWGALTWQAHATRCRQALTQLEWWGANSFAFLGVAIWGDSGSAVNSPSGKAMGILTHISPNVVEGDTLGTRTTRALSQIASLTGLQLTVVDGGPQNLVCDVIEA
jgi:hypothetical protein